MRMSLLALARRPAAAAHSRFAGEGSLLPLAGEGGAKRRMRGSGMGARP